MHYYKFNIADWALHTSHLTLEEEAIYFRLINHYYDTEQPIPIETQTVFRRLRFGSQSFTAVQILAEFFTETEKGFIHNRCEDLLKDYRKTANKNKRNGAKGGRPRKDAASSETQLEPSGFTVETQTEPKYNPNQEPITNNHKPITKETAPVINKTLDWGCIELTAQQKNDIKSIRVAAKAKLTQRSLNTIIKELDLAKASGISYEESIDIWAVRGWKAFTAEWALNHKGKGNETNQRKGLTTGPTISTQDSNF